MKGDVKVQTVTPPSHSLPYEPPAASWVIHLEKNNEKTPFFITCNCRVIRMYVQRNIRPRVEFFNITYVQLRLVESPWG